MQKMLCPVSKVVESRTQLWTLSQVSNCKIQNLTFKFFAACSICPVVRASVHVVAVLSR